MKTREMYQSLSSLRFQKVVLKQEGDQGDFNIIRKLPNSIPIFGGEVKSPPFFYYWGSMIKPPAAPEKGEKFRNEMHDRIVDELLPSFYQVKVRKQCGQVVYHLSLKHYLQKTGSGSQLSLVDYFAMDKKIINEKNTLMVDLIIVTFFRLKV
ncbi:hypothetical protein CEXT_654371 [Caerostris extrusa]|uniref:Uncharacterized protein n=1 Tax=Caerostris extrusa TaxID=172846 RepID=A0AAV4NEL4_CAEEX|nr:hypothetical protein CEXT_654371 [Caerostris extrusa]